MLEDGFISLHRSILKWGWYQDSNTKDLFIHLLLTVNFYDCEWMGNKVLRGQRITSISVLAKEMRLTTQQIRTSINHLISTNEITKLSTPQYTVITILQYDKYQVPNKQNNKRATNEQQLSNKDNKAIKNKDIYITSQSLSMSRVEYDTLVGLFGKVKVDEKIEYAGNYAKLKNYKSLFLTLKNWLKRDNPEAGVKVEVKKPVFEEMEFPK